MSEKLRNLVEDLSTEDKLYVSRLLYMEGFSPTIWCSENPCNLYSKAYNDKQCKDHNCSCDCHLS